jgi:HNH endonuclease
VNRELVRQVAERAGHRCEYCQLPEWALLLPFQIDHIIAEKHGGRTVEDNLALACPHCNRFKGPNIAGIEPETDEVVRLFNPRKDLWQEHFAWDAVRLVGRTPSGRATVHV